MNPTLMLIKLILMSISFLMTTHILTCHFLNVREIYIAFTYTMKRLCDLLMRSSSNYNRRCLMLFIRACRYSIAGFCCARQEYTYMFACMLKPHCDEP